MNAAMRAIVQAQITKAESHRPAKSPLQAMLLSSLEAARKYCLHQRLLGPGCRDVAITLCRFSDKENHHQLRLSPKHSVVTPRPALRLP
jgi:hypothetical protein